MSNTNSARNASNRNIPALLVVLTGTLAATSCDNVNNHAEPDGGSDSSAVQAAEENLGESFDRLEHQLLSEEPSPAREPIASKTAPQGNPDPSEPITVEVYDISVRETSTVVTWGVRSAAGVVDAQQLGINLAGGDIALSELPPFKVKDNPRQSTAMTRLVDSRTGTTYWPWQRPVGSGDTFKGCLCSGSPEKLTETPYIFTTLFPRLATTTDTVGFVIPDFPTIEGIPVSRE